MGSLFQIVYTSTASKEFGRPELLDMLQGSVRRNKQSGITGLLLYKDGCFMQVLEGEEEPVIALFSKISRDPRHHHVIPLLRERIEERKFSHSAMSFHDLHSEELQNLPGYSEFLNTPLNGELMANDLSKCQRLLLLFKKNVR